VGLSSWHLLILGLIAMLVFGGSGRISSLMGDVAKGIKSFRKGLTDDGDDVDGLLASPEVIDHTATKTTERERDVSKTS
jgi:sec-independent protein translocase protein TatA